MIRSWYNQIPYPALKTKREITKCTHWQQFTKGTCGKPMNSSFPDRWSFSYPNLTRICHPTKVSIRTARKVTVRNHNRSILNDQYKTCVCVWRAAPRDGVNFIWHYMCHIFSCLGYATITNRSQPSTPRRREKGQKHTRAKQTNKCTRSTKTSSLFPKRGDQNAKTNGETQEDFKTLSAPWYKPQASQN